MSIITDIATRVHNHNYKIDPIFRSMLDTDFYKLLMAQFIWKKHRNVKATFALKNRTMSVILKNEIPLAALIDQLDHARTVKLSRKESTWLRGNTFYGKRHIFEPEFVDWLENFTLPEYNLTSTETGDIAIEFGGDWLESTMWEIPALSIINELRSRHYLKNLSRFEIDVVYSKAKVKLWDKVDKLRWLYNGGRTPGAPYFYSAHKPQFKISDFGTRRRHSFLWQRWAVQAMIEGIGSNFIGTSNALLAFENDLEAIGTNAHELPMVYAALANSDKELKLSPYKVLEDWQDMYDGNLKVVLPDAFGTTSFLDNAPSWVAEWKGFRPDSKEIHAAIDEIMAFWILHKQNPKEKLIVLSDGMDIDTIVSAVTNYWHQTNISIGWGTNLTNDFKGCMPNNSNDLKAISLVCKVKEVNGRPAVKLSDNVQKATGLPEEIERYKRVFGFSSDNRQVEV